MIILREVEEKDIGGLEHLSALAAEKHPGFLNVPSDSAGWKEKVRFSQKSFAGTLSAKQIGKYIFVAEDVKAHQIVGVSMVSAQHGTPDSPHFYFEVGSEQKFSETINTGFIHGTLKLKVEADGPTEIGGLLVDPTARNNSEERIGRQISFVRFLYIGMHKEKFRKRILAELLPPLTKRGKSPLWEAVGRRFTNMDYWEADYLSAKNKEFILSLFPSGKIYVSLLPAEARNAIGKVSKDTEPVMHMLKKIGFKYHNQVDPFDGGPHLTAAIEEIVPLQKLQALIYSGGIGDALSHASAQREYGLVTVQNGKPFRAVGVETAIEDGKIFFSAEKAAVIEIKPGDAVQFMPYY